MSRSWHPRLAVSLEDELAVAARNDHTIVLSLPNHELHGELGEVIGELSGVLRVEFDPEQAQRMLQRIIQNRVPA